MRISDWSSDVCSSDLLTRQLAGTRRAWHSAAPGSTREPDILRRGRYRRLIGPDTARVVDLLGRALIQRDRFEDFVIDEHDHQRAAFDRVRSEEHTSELQSLMRISYAVFCLKKTNNITPN